MSLQLTSQDAEMLVGLLSTAIVPFVVSYLKQVHWTDAMKWGLAAGISVLAGVLTVYAGGELDQPISIVRAATLIFTASSGFYHMAFKKLGFERMLNPEQHDVP